MLMRDSDLEIHRTTLANGVRILTEKMPHCHSVSMGVWVNVGARDETLTENGLSHFIEHMIFKGTTRRSGYEIAKEFDAVGGNTNAFTSMENTCYHAKVIESHLGTMVDILTDIFLNSVFDEKEVEKERPVILQEIGMIEDAPDEFIHQLTSEAFWGDNPLGRSVLGNRQNIMGVDADMIKGFFRRLYQPERMVISVAGNFDHQRFIDLVAPAFESVQRGNHFPERVTPTGRFLINLNQRELEQSHLCVATNGLSVSDPRRYAFSLINTILGGNMSSRLFQEIRERRGLAYAVYSFVSSHVDTGMFGVYAGVAPDRVYETTRLILEQIRTLKHELVSPAELDAAKEFTKGSLLLAAESVDNQMVRLAQNEIIFERYIPLEEVIEKIETVTSEDILALASTLFQTEQLTLTVLGPAGASGPLEDILNL